MRVNGVDSANVTHALLHKYWLRAFYDDQAAYKCSAPAYKY